MFNYSKSIITLSTKPSAIRARLEQFVIRDRNIKDTYESRKEKEREREFLLVISGEYFYYIKRAFLVRERALKIL
jgi:hypothetical protein